jgi:RNA polymerase sigma-70 factor (ECF subfamily)
LEQDPPRPGIRGSSIRDRWEAGDRDGAYREVLAATGDSLYRFLRHMLRDEEAAREVFQDTYIRVFQALGSFRGEASPTTWVLTIGRNTALNRIRKLRGREDRTASLEEDEVPPEPLIQRTAEEGIATRSVIEAVERLPVAQREAVLLYYIEDRPVAEIAALTGRTENTIKSDLSRARKHLARHLGEEAS